MKKVIYVEDDRDTAESVKLVLEKAGYVVELAFNGREALMKIPRGGFDLALMDIMMSDMSGWDLFQKIRTKKMKFAFLSALPISDERLKELHKVGISDYITKPFDGKDLIARVKSMVG
jgi:two-component system, OmpR family, response regulator VicR